MNTLNEAACKNNNCFSDTFNLYAAYYDLLYADKDYKAESDYIESIINKHGSNVGSILDLGCGTGIHALMLAKKGFYIHGVDISSNMIEQAKQKMEQNFAIKKSLKFDVGDIRGLDLNSKFDAVVSIFHVISYLTTNCDIHSFFATAAHHLNKDGLLIFDFWYGPAVLTQKPIVKIKRLENNDLRVTRISEPESHLNENVIDVNFHIFAQSKMDNQINDFKEIHKMRYFFKPELEMFAAHGGFEILNFEEWLTGIQPNEQSWGACVICKKI
ncbi:MAG: Methyltransferase type 11 [candidate division TM6 bacterium GW2011_GWF2_37_49]|nr:MAG: Methyltransferase type 11 [candidate division TM6 bacterium GW2011_GWF2_37_49]